MADNKYRYPPAPPNARGTFSDELVGFQLVDGGGLTQGNFEFSRNVVEKVNRNFSTGVFSNPISLKDLDFNSLEESKMVMAKNFKVYPNYDISQVTNFTLYGSLRKRFSTSVIKIINYFPGAIQVDRSYYDLTTGYTAYNISYDDVEGLTTFDIDVNRFKNAFDIDYSENADRNISVRPFETSPLRNLTRNYLKYALFFQDLEEEYKFVDFDPSPRLSAGTVTVVVEGNPFNGQLQSTKTILLKPNKFETEKSFKDDFDEVEDFLLNRLVSPKYTASFKVLREGDTGTLYASNEKVTWPTEGSWNLDIRTAKFDTYLEKLDLIAFDLDELRTDLISRFLTTGAFKDFDTQSQNVEKVLQLYGRSFDETKKFIDALAYMNSVHYTVKDDIPSQLLKNLAQTLGWDTNISLITNDNFLNSIFGTQTNTNYTGESREKTPTELDYQYYRNLILNSAYLFKSKGTRRSIEALMRMIGAPEALIEFNETIYLADGPINIERFNEEYATITGGTKITETPVLDPNVTFNIEGVVYTGFTTQLSISTVDASREDYPVDENGYPKAMTATEDTFFEKGAGWYEQTPEHRAPEQLDITGSVFTGQNPSVQTSLEPFTFGQKYFDKFRYFPYMDMGFGLTRVPDNTKSWTDRQIGLRRNTQAGFDANYVVDNEKLVLNAKNIDLGLNMGQGIIYDIWTMSKKYNYPIPSTGLTTPYPYPKGVDWTVINPKPKEKTFFEFAQTFYRNMINVRNRQTITDGKGGGYPTLQSLYWKYLNSEEAVGIPSNKYTYQKMIDFTNGIGDYWMKLVEQMIPASTIWMGGQKMENNVLQRQKVVWRRQRGCELVPIPCIPCTFTGQLLGADCVTQTLSCNIGLSNPQNTLTNSISNAILSEGYIISDCVLNTLQSLWYVDIRLSGSLLRKDLFYTGYGGGDYPSSQEWLDAVESSLNNLYENGLNYSINGTNITVSNIGCNNDFTGESLQINAGVNININCEG
jgi:hypothetical protein